MNEVGMVEWRDEFYKQVLDLVWRWFGDGRLHHQNSICHRSLGGADGTYYGTSLFFIQ